MELIADYGFENTFIIIIVVNKFSVFHFLRFSSLRLTIHQEK